MNCRPCTQMISFLPLGGLGAVVEADRNAAGFELGGLMIDGSLTKVTTVRTTRIRAAAIVHPISRRVLPWIWAATAPRLARNLNTEYASAPSTITNTTAAM